MNERLVILSFNDGEVGATLTTNYRYITVLVAGTIVGVVASPHTNDSDATIDINDDGAEIIGEVDCAVKATPGSWISTHLGGEETPVAVAAGSVLSLDANDLDSDTRVLVQIWMLTGETTA